VFSPYAFFHQLHRTVFLQYDKNGRSIPPHITKTEWGIWR